jgi:hypothetical protein
MQIYGFSKRKTRFLSSPQRQDSTVPVIRPLCVMNPVDIFHKVDRMAARRPEGNRRLVYRRDDAAIGTELADRKT